MDWTEIVIVKKEDLTGAFAEVALELGTEEALNELDRAHAKLCAKRLSLFCVFDMTETGSIIHANVSGPPTLEELVQDYERATKIRKEADEEFSELHKMADRFGYSIQAIELAAKLRDAG
jgi:hypothetical protein